jgi:hypothetical protein
VAISTCSVVRQGPAGLRRHLFAQDRASILDAMNRAVTRLCVYETVDAADSDAA